MVAAVELVLSLVLKMEKIHWMAPPENLVGH
jgi:hypothetical protein